MKKIKIILGIVLLVFLLIVLISIIEESDKETDQVITQKVDQSEFVWFKYSNNPVLKEQPNTHWFQWAGDPFVIQDGSEYKMWFGANVKDGVTQIGYATSNDGKNWKIHPEPVLRIGDEGAWDDFSVETPSVIKNPDETYEMWYTGAGGAPEDESAGWDRLHKKTSRNSFRCRTRRIRLE